MKFETVLRLMRKGKKIRMRYWGQGEYIKSTGDCIVTEEPKRYDISSTEVLSEEWEEYK